MTLRSDQGRLGLISSRRFYYHLMDIAEIQAMKGSVPGIHLLRLSQMQDEARDFEAANPDEAKRVRAIPASTPQTEGSLTRPPPGRR